MAKRRTEAQTRQEIIDHRLRLAGWNVDDPSQVVQELDIYLERRGEIRDATPDPYRGHRFADYALIQAGVPAAVVEAKKTAADARLGQEQAIAYARDLQQLHGGALPFATYTNGHDIYFWEPDFYPPIQVHGFPTRADIDWLIQRRDNRRPLSAELINSDIAGRAYQIEGIRSILEALEGKKTKFLLVMATGTGKTRTAVALADVLMRSRWAKRVLFLVDRIALQQQALNEAFKEHLPAEPRWPAQGEKRFARNRRIYVTTYPKMLNFVQAGTTSDSYISPFFFDLIIADESHRSIYNVYRQVIDYFHGIKLGLTATPREHVDLDTFALFDCDPQLPTFAYSFQEAIGHDPPYLCDFEVLKVRTKFQLEGIQGPTLPQGEQLQLLEEGRDPEDIDFEGTDLEFKVTNAPTNAIIVREFMEESIKDPGGTLPGKSIIFAVSKKHARRLQDLFDQLYPEHRGRLARVIVSDDRYAHGRGGLIDQFKHHDMPRVAISVDMLDTGVDIREVVNLVFAKPVYSYIKFWQMIGRGTRVLLDDPARRKTWCPEKDRFLIIDCWGNFDFFKMEPKGREPGTLVPMPVRLFRARLDKLEAALALQSSDPGEVAAEAIAGVVEDIRSDLESLPVNNVVVRERAAELERVTDAAFWRRPTARDLGFLRATIAPILRARTGDDFKALRFERDVIEFGTASLANQPEVANVLRDSIVAQIAELPLSVNVVDSERALIDRVQTPAWWAGVTDAGLRDVARRLAPLMKYRQERRDPIMTLELADARALKETVEFGPENERMTTAAYRDKVETAIRMLVAQNPALQKIQRGEDIGEAELDELAAFLRDHDPHVTEELLQKIYDNRAVNFLALIRHVLGLEEVEGWSTAVTRQFDEFVSRHPNLSTIQLQFIQTLRSYILQTRRLEKRHLVEQPFTQIHPKGIRGIFREDEIQEILRFTGELIA